MMILLTLQLFSIKLAFKNLPLSMESALNRFDAQACKACKEPLSQLFSYLIAWT